VRKHLFRWAPLLLYMALITWLSSRTGGGLPSYWFMKFDKVLHAMEYFGLGFLICRALGVKRWYWAAAAGLAFGLGFGMVDEFHQSFVDGRQGNDPGDLLADAIGSTLGALAYKVVRRS
jgi:VanZ family protein